MSMYKGIELPNDTIEMMAGQSDAECERLAVMGAMRSAGIYQRTHSTNLAEGKTTLRFASINAISSVLAKELCEAFATVVYELVDAEFFQTQREKTDSTEDRVYFHAICNHKKTGF